MKRRQFLAAAASLGAAPLIGCSRKSASTMPPGELRGGNFELGHRLLRGDFPPPDETRRVPGLIVGAGIGGLSAAWRLDKAGMHDYQMLELETQPGGNSRWGESEVSPHPFGAHYLPLPPREAVWVREMLADLGAIEGDPQAAKPRYDETRLCHAPQERLYIGGFWQEGVMPRLGVAAAEREQMARFQERINELKQTTDFLGRRAFALPLDLSSRDARWTALDSITMKEWLLGNGYTSPHLHWYVNYACRDDYGTDYAATSAWAGLHYFACRNGEAANAAGDAVLTAPEGNGWMVKKLVERVGPRLMPGAAVFRLEQGKKGVTADVWLATENRSVRIETQRLIWAAPLFLLPKLAAGLPAPLAAAIGGISYAPWLVANLTLDALPHAGAGAPMSWDNVLLDSPALGYVVATHQQIRSRSGPTVLTYYHALSDQAPALARQRLLETPREAWAARILADLSRAHGDLPALTRRIDVFRHGHAMARPTPGALWGEQREVLQQGWGRVSFAHADVSGLSLFEEANYRGVMAAERTLAALGRV